MVATQNHPHFSSLWTVVVAESVVVVETVVVFETVVVVETVESAVTAQFGEYHLLAET